MHVDLIDSGKTHALAAFVVSAAERLAAAKSNARILISAHTNVAVAAPLRRSSARGFTEDVVGALEGSITRFYRIRYTSPRRGGKRKGGEGGEEPVLSASGRALRGKGADHARELRAMLRDATTARERAVLQRELASAQAGTADARARALSKCRVVGVTTASCGNDAMKDFTFAVAILDECSQMTEPSSMLAMSRFGCRAPSRSATRSSSRPCSRANRTIATIPSREVSSSVSPTPGTDPRCFAPSIDCTRRWRLYPTGASTTVDSSTGVPRGSRAAASRGRA